jgi:hypothetical protein
VPARPIQEFLVDTQSPGDDKIEWRRGLREVLHPTAEDVNLAELQCADDFGKKCGFLLIAFDKRTGKMRNCHTDGYGWEAGTGPNVGEPTMPYGNGGDPEEAFAKMEAEDLNGIDYGGQGDLLIPAEEEINVGANGTAHLRTRRKSIHGENARDERIGQWLVFHTM